MAMRVWVWLFASVILGTPAFAQTRSDIPTPDDVAVPVPQRDYSPAETQLLQELDARRIKLQRREQALELREKLVDLAEERLTGKVRDLRNLQDELEKLLKNLSTLEEEELGQLARIYENMKPDSAAEVLNKLDNAIVYDVMKRMNTKKSAKVMEQLAKPKARFLSEMLAEPKILPQLGNGASGQDEEQTAP